MTESTLSLTTKELRDRIALAYIGGEHPEDDGDAYDALTAGEEATVDRFLNQGLRRFNSPMLAGKTHSWSFLKPFTSLTINAAFTGSDGVEVSYDHTGGASELLVTLAGDTWPSWFDATSDEFTTLRIAGVDYYVATWVSTTTLTLSTANNPGENVDATEDFSLHQDNYLLPDDYGNIDGNVTFIQANNAYSTCRRVMPETIEVWRMQGPNIGRNTPSYFAIRPRARSETEGTKQEILFYPAISQASTAQFRYRVRANALSNEDGYPYGASDHSETILAACLAVAEEEGNDGQHGGRWQTYQELLAASIFFDSRFTRAETYGRRRRDPRYGGMGPTIQERLFVDPTGGLPHYTSP